MFPFLLQLTIPAAVPRLMLVLALSLGLTVLGLSLLIRERTAILRSLVTVCAVITLLFALKLQWSSRIHFGVTPFGAALALGLCIGWAVCLRSALQHGLDREWMTRCLGAAVLGGILGARLGYVLLCAPREVPLSECFRFNTGGLFGYGAYFGGALGAAWASRDRGRQLRRWLDLGSPTFLAVIAVTRVGCYLEGSDFGRPTGPSIPRFLRNFGTYPRWNPMADGSFGGPPAWLHHVSDFGLSTDSVTSLATHPTQLYELLLVLILGGIAIRSNRAKAFDGRTFLLIALSYSAGRYFLEMLRGDPDRGLFAAPKQGHQLALFSWTQLCAIASMLLLAWYWRKWRSLAAFSEK